SARAHRSPRDLRDTSLLRRDRRAKARSLRIDKIALSLEPCPRREASPARSVRPDGDVARPARPDASLLDRRTRDLPRTRRADRSPRSSRAGGFFGSGGSALALAAARLRER